MMQTHYIDIDGYWGVVFCHGFDITDADEMAAIMDSFGMNRSKARKAVRILLGVNTGMAVSREDLRMSVIFVGKCSSMEQFADTVAHESLHVARAICDYYGVPCDSEDEAWTLGYIVRGIAEELNMD